MFEKLSVKASKTHRWSDKRRVIPAALAIAALVVPVVSSASAEEARIPASAAAPVQHGPKPTVVLVHGAFADSSSWNAVIGRLQHDGYAVITNAAVGHTNVKALVYIAAFAPDQGETGLGLTTQFPGSQLGAALVVRPYATAGGGGADGYVDPAKFHSVFAADLPVATTDLMAATQRPVDLAALQAPSGVPAWKTIPSWYLVAGSDRAIPAAAEEFMAKRANAHTVKIKGASHVVMISHPGRTKELIAAAAKATD